jgi:hypothetical protein
LAPLILQLPSSRWPQRRIAIGMRNDNSAAIWAELSRCRYDGAPVRAVAHRLVIVVFFNLEAECAAIDASCRLAAHPSRRRQV